MHPFLTESRRLVAADITEYLNTAGSEALSLTPWGPDVRDRLLEYTLRGKLIRGSLVGFSYRLVNPQVEPHQACSQAGAAMELLQSFLLIHDDIMDQDTVRRGKTLDPLAVCRFGACRRSRRRSVRSLHGNMCRRHRRVSRS
jgi:geranylgeranyl diphosphate synthase type I